MWIFPSPRENCLTWSLFLPCVTNSLPTLIRGFSKFLYRSSVSTPNNLATLAPSYNGKQVSWLKNEGQRVTIAGIKAFEYLLQFRRLRPVLRDLVVWISWYPCAWRRQWFCKCRSSLLVWNPRHRRLAIERKKMGKMLAKRAIWIWNEKVWIIVSLTYVTFDFGGHTSEQNVNNIRKVFEKGETFMIIHV